KSGVDRASLRPCCVERCAFREHWDRGRDHDRPTLSREGEAADSTRGAVDLHQGTALPGFVPEQYRRVEAAVEVMRGVRYAWWSIAPGVASDDEAHLAFRLFRFYVLPRQVPDPALCQFLGTGRGARTLPDELSVTGRASRREPGSAAGC